jgi:hypothetical protein
VADAFYDNFRTLMVSFGNDGVHGAIDLGAGGNNIKFILYDETDDALNLADQDIADIVAGGRTATSGNIAGQTVGVAAVGAFDHDNYTFTAQAGDQFESLTYYKDSGVESTSPLICNIDSATGLPMTPNGGDIIWTPAAGGVFQIT